MTPAARVAAAIEVLDTVFGGQPAERALKAWGRSHRFAGSKDRAAIRDHVFQALRCRASYGWLGGAETGRGVMLGAMRDAGLVDEVFTGEGHAPPPVGTEEGARALDDASRDVRGDMPDWLLPHFDGAFADQADAVLQVLRHRAGVFLRVNTAKATVEQATQALAQNSIGVEPVSGVKTALQVVENERKVSLSQAYQNGLVELQDPSSQQAVAALDLNADLRVLDYCAGGGGKALAMAATGAQVVAHDIDPARMVDLAPRAERAGTPIAQVATRDLGRQPPFDLVFCDAPCSGSGTWRRTPEAKWALSPDRLDALTAMQDDVLDAAISLVKTGGRLVYATCSVFDVENKTRVSAVLARHPGLMLTTSVSFAPRPDCDGFFYAVIEKP